jgi:GNAT superfamily N-acetyltransferase
MNITILRATPDQSQKLTQIAHAAKRHWGYPESWIAVWKDVLTITPDFITGNKAYVAFVDEEVAGFYAVLDRGEKAILDHMWIMPRYIGTGVGREMFKHAVETASSLGASSIEIEADPNAEGFYARMGARRIGENSYEIEGSPRVLPLLIVDLERDDLQGPRRT